MKLIFNQVFYCPKNMDFNINYEIKLSFFGTAQKTRGRAFCTSQNGCFVFLTSSGVHGARLVSPSWSFPVRFCNRPLLKVGRPPRWEVWGGGGQAPLELPSTEGGGTPRSIPAEGGIFFLLQMPFFVRPLFLGSTGPLPPRVFDPPGVAVGRVPPPP